MLKRFFKRNAPNTAQIEVLEANSLKNVVGGLEGVSTTNGLTDGSLSGDLSSTNNRRPHAHIKTQ